MNAVTERRSVQTGTAHGGGQSRIGGDAHGYAHGADPAGEVFTLRRSGKRPLRFQGWQLVEASGRTEGARLWCELNLYQTLASAVVIEMTVRRADLGERDLSRVEVCTSLQTAADWLEAYAPSHDVPVSQLLVTDETALGWTVLQAVQLRQRLRSVDEDYRALISEVFAALDLTVDSDQPDAAAQEIEQRAGE